jgi:hypothetical protein
VLSYNGSKETDRFIVCQITVAEFIIMTLPLVRKVSVFLVYAMTVYGGGEGSRSIPPFILFLSNMEVNRYPRR